MIYTVTFNPAIDYVINTGKIQPGSVNRAQSENIFFGGKGINVSAVLAELGISSTALGFTAGFTGEAIERGVSAMGINAGFIRLRSGNSRINVKLRSECETEINGQGPDIDGEALSMLRKRLDSLSSGDTLILAGSVPKSLPDDIYEQILADLSDRDIISVVDASSGLLRNVLKYKPFLIKPNDIELGELFGTELKTDEEVIFYADKLREMGARSVLVSMAERGAVLVDENGRSYRQEACRGAVRNSVGAGDSMLAGFIAGLESGGHGYALKLGTACGGATAFSDGLARKEDIYALLEQL